MSNRILAKQALALSGGVSEAERPQLCTGFTRMTPEQIQALRHAYNLSQDKFAKKFGIPVATLRAWEQGHRSPSASANSLLHAVLDNVAPEMEVT